MVRLPQLLCIVLATAVGLCAPAARAGEDRRTTTVGLPARIEGLVLPGPELEVAPQADHNAPLVVRITNTYKHGTGYRYDLVYYALEPGEYDLTKVLRRRDGSPKGDLPAVTVSVRAVLPPGQVLPHDLEPRPAPSLGGYRLALVAGSVVWGLGLLAILLLGRRRRAAAAADEARPRSLADQLRPLVEEALAGRLTTPRRAELERLLLAYWRRRLDLQGQKPHEAFATLRRHPEAGPLLTSLEAWLHRPDPAGEIDLPALLRPYQNAPAEASEGSPC
jgi:hypothetical protein